MPNLCNKLLFSFPWICFKSLFVPGVCCPGQGVNQGINEGINQGANQGANPVNIGPQQSLPPINQNQVPEFVQDDLDVVIQPQGSTKRPKLKLPSLADLPSTTPRPSPLLQGVLQTVPGSNQGLCQENILSIY